MGTTPSRVIIAFIALTATVVASPVRALGQSEWKVPEEARALENPVKGVGDIAGEIQAKCAGCHGSKGDGDGPALGYFRLPKPADWRSPHVQQQTDGELFWKITHGRLGVMPSHGGPVRYGTVADGELHPGTCPRRPSPMKRRKGD